MNKIQVYIAVTLDGFIAREDGALEWLLEWPNPNQIDHGYNAFISEVDIIIMGRKTYEVVLGFGIPWPYADSRSYVVTRNLDYKVSTENTFLLHEVDAGTIGRLQSESKKNIWLVGGGELISHFLNEGTIDEMVLCMIPIVLGKGIPLFPNQPKETQFELVKAEPYETGIVNLTYRRKQEAQQ